jgi:hypothetical protein
MHMTTHAHEPRQQRVDSTQEGLTHQLVTFINSELLVEERDLIRDVERYVQENGPWRYRLSHIYDEPEVLTEVERLTTEQDKKIAA